MIGNEFWRVNVVAIDWDNVPTTPSASARRARRSLAVLSRLGLLSFVALLLLMPSSEVNERPDRLDEPRQQCGPLKLDFSDPCNAAAIALF